MKTTTVEIEDILIGPVEAADFLKEISNKPIGMRTISSYVTLKRMPVLKYGSTTLFSRKSLAEWERAGRPNQTKK